MAERQKYKITDPASGRVITVTTDKQMTTELGMEYLKKAFGGKLTFDELANDTNYLADLRASHYKDANEKWQGTDQELIEKDFEYWNMVENNLAVGANELATSFADLDQKDAQRLLRRYDVYDRTAATGEGSRAGWEQFKGVSKAMLTDPTNYAGGIGIFKLLASKLGAKGAMRFILTKIAAPSAIGASYAAASNAQNQQMKVQLGERESIDGGELAANTLVGAATGPLATPAVKAVAAAGRVFNPASYGRGIDSAKRAVAETMGGQKAAQTGVIDEGKQAMDSVGDGGLASASESASVKLSDELAAARQNFDDKYTELGELGVSPQAINSFLQNIYSRGIKQGALPDLEDAVRLMQEGKLSPTDTLREIRRQLGIAGFSKDFKGSTNILRDLKDQAQKLFTESAEKSGKGEQAAKLDAAYSNFSQLDNKIRQSAGKDTKVSNLLDSLVTVPEKSSTRMKDFFKEIERIGKASGNENFVVEQKELLRMAMSEKLFAGNSAKFKNFVRSDSGRQALKQLYPEVKDQTLLRWAKILENSQEQGSAALFWGRYIAQGLAFAVPTAAGAGGGQVLSGAATGGAALVIFRSLLDSPQFTKLAMNVYSKDKVNKPALRRMQKYLVKKGMTEENARTFTKQMAGQAITQGIADNPPEFAVEQAMRVPEMLPTAPAGQ